MIINKLVLESGMTGPTVLDFNYGTKFTSVIAQSPIKDKSDQINKNYFGAWMSRNLSLNNILNLNVGLNYTEGLNFLGKQVGVNFYRGIQLNERP